MLTEQKCDSFHFLSPHIIKNINSWPMATLIGHASWWEDF